MTHPIKRCILPQAKRKTIQESWFLKAQQRSVRFLEAAPEDETVALEFLCDAFIHQDPINIAAGVTADEFYQQNQEKVRKCIKESRLIIAADCFEICGIGGHVIERTNSNEKPEIKSDYTNEINSFSSNSLAIRKCKVFTELNEKILQYYMPENCHQVMRIEMLSVRYDYQRSGLATKLWLEMLRKAGHEDLHCVDSICSIHASNKIALKLGMQIVFKFPYKDFCMNGQPVFGDTLCDGSTHATLLVGDLDKMLSIHGLEDQPIQMPDFYKLPINLKRESLGELFVPKLKRSIRFEVVHAEDTNVVLNFLRNEFFKQAPMARTMQLGKEEQAELVESFEAGELAKNLSIVAVDEGKICGVLVNVVEKFHHLEMHNGNVELKEDFTKEINNMNASSLKFKQIRAFLQWFDSIVPKFFPINSEAFVLKKLSVHPSYKGCKIGLNLWTRGLKLAKDRGFKFAYGECNAKGSQQIAKQSGMEQLLSYPFRLCKYDGKPIFPDGKMFDGCDSINLYRVDLESFEL